jgi:hypothetical protein
LKIAQDALGPHYPRLAVAVAEGLDKKRYPVGPAII